MFEIIQILRASGRRVTDEQLSDRLEVSPRTIYRDIAALQSMRTPVEGAAGLGYILRQSYDLPPLNFDSEEIEALQVGLLMLARIGDRSFWCSVDADISGQSGFLMFDNMSMKRPVA